MTECTHCPPNTKQCAHLDGHWVRLVVKPKLSNPYRFGIHWSWPPESSSLGFFYKTLPEAEGLFHSLNVEMKIIAREVPGDVCT